MRLQKQQAEAREGEMLNVSQQEHNSAANPEDLRLFLAI